MGRSNLRNKAKKKGKGSRSPKKKKYYDSKVEEFSY